jgi:iron complex transport system permease protein
MTQNKIPDPSLKTDHLQDLGPVKSHQATGMKGSLVLTGLAIGLCVMVVIALTIGRYPISISELPHLVWKALWHHDIMEFGASSTVLFNIRLPRMCAAILVGMALSGSGACYQGIFRNPMVDPSLLGVTAGSAFGAALAILLSIGVGGIQLFSFGFGLISVFATVMLSTFVGKRGEKTLTLVLCGIVTGTLFSAMVSMIKYVADPFSKLPAITYWLMGSLASINLSDVRIAAIASVGGIIPLLLVRWRINVLSFGDEEAKAMGVDAGRIRAIAIVSSTLMTASAVSISGMVGWIGLVVPHLARMLVGPSFPVLLPASLLLGGTFLLVVDTVARVAFPIEIPIGILTAIIGAPFFVFLLARGRRGWL